MWKAKIITVSRRFCLLEQLLASSLSFWKNCMMWAVYLASQGGLKKKDVVPRVFQRCIEELKRENIWFYCFDFKNVSFYKFANSHCWVLFLLFTNNNPKVRRTYYFSLFSERYVQSWAGRLLPFPNHLKAWLITSRERNINNVLTACIVQFQCPHKQHGCWKSAWSTFQTGHTWLIGQLLRNRAGDGPLQTGSSTPCNGGTYFVWLKEDDGWSANRLSAHHHYDLPSVHFPASIPNSPLHHPQTTMSWLMISFPLGRQIYPFLFLPHSGHLSNQTGLPLGRGAQGQDWVTHSGWVNTVRGTLGGKKFSSFNLD